MKFHSPLNALVFVALLIKSCTYCKWIQRTNSSTSKNIKDVEVSNATINLLHSKHKHHCLNSSGLKSINQNKTKNHLHELHANEQHHLHEGIMQFLFPEVDDMKEDENNSMEDKSINSKIKQKKPNSNRAKENNRSSSKKRESRKEGKVFKDTREDVMHYKLIDNMMFKPLDSNNSASIVFSDESEITQDDVDQAIEGRDGSCIAIPIKHKTDIYKEFLRWAHLHEKNERRAKIEKEVIQKYKNKSLYANNKNITSDKDLPNLTSKINISNKPVLIRSSSVYYNTSSQSRVYLQNGKRAKNTTQNIHSSNKIKSSSLSSQQKHSQKTKQGKHETKDFKVESVELKYDPDFLDKLHNSVKEHTKSSKKTKKKKIKKQKLRQTYEGNPADISANDYSAQEAFMMNTQKEAMGRRFYQMFENKTASDFWDNNTLETTKMLEFLIPLGEHLHKTLDEPPPNQGEHFMTDLKMYKTELEKFIVLVKKDKAETRNDVVALIEEPYEHVCETKFSEDEVKIMFGWNDEEYKQFEHLFEETRELWFDLQLFHHCYQFVSESAESYSAPYNYTKEEQIEIIKNNTWQQTGNQ